jgi:hypothetical protein
MRLHSRSSSDSISLTLWQFPDNSVWYSFIMGFQRSS